MKLLILGSLIIGIFGFVSAMDQTTTIPSTAIASGTNPCAALSMSAEDYMSNYPKATVVPFIPSDVYACGQDVPINETLAISQISWIKEFIQFQSTLAYLKNPPTGYLLPPVDLVGGLDAIAKNTAAGHYENEYDFEIDMWSLINSAADGHLSFIPYLMGAFQYSRSPLVSVSLDGIDLPKVYFLSDIQAAYASLTTNITPSAVMSINGEDVNQYLQNDLYNPSFQDLDAQYNSLFYNPATVEFGSTYGGFAGGLFVYQNDTTSYTFEDGTNLSQNSNVSTAMDLTFDSGIELFQQLLTPSITKSSSATSSATTANNTTPVSSPKPTISGYPYPVVKHSADVISGYFLNSSRTSDVAVLSILSFFNTFTPVADQVAEFQNDTRHFLALCKEKNKTQLIVDLRGNGGGDPYLAYDTFKQLFPSLIPYSGTQIRDSPASNILGQEISRLAASGEVGELLDTFFNYKSSLQSPDGPLFDSWDELYGPVEVYGDRFSNTASWKFSNAALDIASSTGIVVSGYANNSYLPAQVFAAKNITLLTDGQCSSTCGIFANLILNQGAVRSVVAGGRPNIQPMAVIGGTQGGEDLTFSDLAKYAQASISFANATSANSTSSNLAELSSVLTPLTERSPLNYSPGHPPSLNFRNSIAQGDETLMPLQFTTRYADCRFFYVPLDIINVTSTWVRVARGVMNNGSGLCINGTLEGSATQLSNSTSSVLPQGASPPTQSAPSPISLSNVAATTQLKWGNAAFILGFVVLMF